MIVVKPKIPIEAQGQINRLTSEIEREKLDMTVKENVPKGGVFILHDTAYRAVIALAKGAVAVPGKNCMVVNLNDILGGN